MSNRSKAIVNLKEEQLARFFASMSSTSRLAILDALASRGSCEADIKEVAGLSRFTVGTNLKYLKNYGLIKGSITSKNTSYCIDYDKLKEFKTLFDDFYNKVTENKPVAGQESISCVK